MGYERAKHIRVDCPLGMRLFSAIKDLETEPKRAGAIWLFSLVQDVLPPTEASSSGVLGQPPFRLHQAFDLD
jgi:hypothetical protein